MTMVFTGLIAHCLLYPMMGGVREDAWKILKASYYLLVATWVPVALLINIFELEAINVPVRHIWALAIPGALMLDVGYRQLREISFDMAGTFHRIVLAIVAGLPLIPVVHYVFLAASSLMTQSQTLT